jgi:hypothetical protein
MILCERPQPNWRSARSSAVYSASESLDTGQRNFEFISVEREIETRRQCYQLPFLHSDLDDLTSHFSRFSYSVHAGVSGSLSQY